MLHAARARGFAMIDEVFAPGMAALAPALLAAAAELGPIGKASTLLGRPAVGKA